jgi:hypothetical protein
MKRFLQLLFLLLGNVALSGSDSVLSVVVTPDANGRWIMMEPRVSVHWSEDDVLVLRYWSAANMIEGVMELRSADGVLQKEDIWTGPRPATETVEVTKNQTRSFLGFCQHYSGLKAGKYIAKIRVAGRTGTHDQVVIESTPVAVYVAAQKEPNKALVPTVMSVTPAADAPVAPATTAAHL